MRLNVPLTNKVPMRTQCSPNRPEWDLTAYWYGNGAPSRLLPAEWQITSRYKAEAPKNPAVTRAEE